MSRVVTRKSLYVEAPLEATQEHLSTVPQRAIYTWVRLFFISALLTSILALSLLQVGLYVKLLHYREEIRSLEEAIDNLSIKNEALRLEAERLASPSRLKEEGKRLNLQPSERVIILPVD